MPIDLQYEKFKKLVDEQLNALEVLDDDQKKEIRKMLYAYFEKSKNITKFSERIRWTFEQVEQDLLNKEIDREVISQILDIYVSELKNERENYFKYGKEFRSNIRSFPAQKTK